MTPAEFIAAFPAFEEEMEEADIQRHIDDAVLDLDVGVWGTFYDRGLGLLVAHNIVMEKVDAAAVEGGLTGAAEPGVQSKNVDGVSISYFADAAGADEYDQTSYGTRYKALRRRVGFGAVAV